MLILGIAGGIYHPCEEDALSLGDDLFHDASAALVKDGKVVAAIEEERLTRIKHTNRAPLKALRFCLRQARVQPRDIDYFAYYIQRSTLTSALHFRPSLFRMEAHLWKS